MGSGESLPVYVFLISVASEINSERKNDQLKKKVPPHAGINVVTGTVRLSGLSWSCGMSFRLQLRPQVVQSAEFSVVRFQLIGTE